MRVVSLLTYHWRANAIRKRGSGPYDDRLGEFRISSRIFRQRLAPSRPVLTNIMVCRFDTGPTVLCLSLFAAVVTNFILRVSSLLPLSTELHSLSQTNSSLKPCSSPPRSTPFLLICSFAGIKKKDPLFSPPFFRALSSFRCFLPSPSLFGFP